MFNLYTVLSLVTAMNLECLLEHVDDEEDDKEDPGGDGHLVHLRRLTRVTHARSAVDL